jgi:hypothetical protein
MSENSTNRVMKEDEIDLLDLFKRLGNTFRRWGKSIGRALLVSFVFMAKRWLPLGISIVLGVGASYLTRSLSDSYFTSDLVLRNNVTSTADMISYLNRLHTLSISTDKMGLSNSISVTMKQAKNIIDISAFWVIDKGKDGTPDYVDLKNNHNVYDTLNVRMLDRLNVRVRIKSPKELSIIQSGIIGFINKDSLFQQMNRVRISQNRILLTRLEYDIQQLDSLQKIKYFEETKNRYPDKGGQMIFLQEQKTQLVYSDIYSLYDRRNAYERDMNLYKDIVTVLSDFSQPSRRDNGGLYYAEFLVPLFFILTLITLLIRANYRKLEEVFKKY